MRRILAVAVTLLACLLGPPATAHAASSSLGGGSALFTPTGNLHCTAAFAATGGGYGHLVAGPGCAGATTLYSGDNVLVGPVVAATAAYSVVRVTNTAAWTLVGWLDTGAGRYSIAGSRQTPVGGSVCLLDQRLGTHCGTVTALNQTVGYPDGTVVTGLTRTNVCMEPGGTPVAFVTGDQAQGVPFGGSGTCFAGGAGWFYPINRVLSAYGLTLVTG